MKNSFVNLNRLKGKMKENQITIGELSKNLSISYVSLNFKLNGKTQFKDSEIAVLEKLFGTYIFNLTK